MVVEDFVGLMELTINIFWNCQVIRVYWKEIHKHLQHIFGLTIPFELLIVYLDDVNYDNWQINGKKLHRMLLAGSKKAKKMVEGKSSQH